MEEDTGKKHKVIIIIISIIGAFALIGLTLSLIFVYKMKNAKPEEPKSSIDMAKFEEYQKRLFGFVNPDKSKPLAEELDVHWQKPNPGPFVWGKVEKEKGKYDFTEADKLVRRAQEEGMITVAVLWPYADWDQVTCHQKLPNSPRKDFPELGDYRQKPCDMEAYKGFVTAVINRYDGDGPNDMDGLKYPIKYWEVMEWPEMSGEQVFFASDKRADDYIEILRATSGLSTLKDSNPPGKVINGGMADLTSAEGSAFWRRVLTEAKDSIDIVGYNLISRDATENTEMTSLKALMAELKIEKPIWVTGVWLGAPGETQISQEKWAEYLVKAYVGTIGNGASKFFYAGLNQTEEVSKNAAMLSCEGQSNNCARQKTLDAYKTMVKKIDKFDKVEKIKEGQYRFFHNQKATYVIWLGRFPNELVEEIKITDASGVEAIRIASDLTNFNGLLYVEDVKR